jgi:hypothetical protein
MRRRDLIKLICGATVALALMPALAIGQATRTFTFSNQCIFPVFPGATSGATGTSCQSGACGTGQVCNPVNNLCYYKQLTTTNGQPLDAYTLQLPSLSTVQVTIPVLSTGTTDTVWSGNVWAGTDVDSGPSRTIGTVATGYCAASVNFMWTLIPCNAFTSPQNTPLTKAEFTLVNSTDFYDISAIHGANIPVSMEPTAGQNLGPVPSSDDPNLKYYWCTAPGSVDKSPTATCTWQFPPPNNGLRMSLVQHQQMPTLCSDPNQSCPNDAQGRRQVCGIAFDSSKGVTGLYQECGNTGDRGGTWSATQICAAIGYNNSNLNPNQVSTQLINSLNCGTGPNSANAALFQCTGINAGSCYTPGATTNCCGCPNWPLAYKPAGGNFDRNNPDTNRCFSTNPNWTSVSYPWLPYLKKACPPVYSYQYDDVTSTFKCSTSPNTTINATNYTVTFCPSHLRAISP